MRVALFGTIDLFRFGRCTTPSRKSQEKTLAMSIDKVYI